MEQRTEVGGGGGGEGVGLGVPFRWARKEQRSRRITSKFELRRANSEWRMTERRSLSHFWAGGTGSFAVCAASNDTPLIRPPATFSPTSGAKGHVPPRPAKRGEGPRSGGEGLVL